jgi:tRNA A37 N6-isopentenylltransferase MiaA
MSAVGYAEFQPYFGGRCPEPGEGETKLDEVLADIETSLHRFVRHQYNWFSDDDPAIHWFDVTSTDYQEIEAFVCRWLEKQCPGRFASSAP